jgi:hypothetical protein
VILTPNSIPQFHLFSKNITILQDFKSEHTFIFTAFSKRTSDSIDQMAEATLFAVKTCRRFQEERLPFIKESWAKAARHLIYVGDDTDETLGVNFTNILHAAFLYKSFVQIFLYLYFRFELFCRGNISANALIKCW